MLGSEATIYPEGSLLRLLPAMKGRYLNKTVLALIAKSGIHLKLALSRSISVQLLPKPNRLLTWFVPAVAEVASDA